MKRIVFFFMVCLLSRHSLAQMASIDKNKVMDFFQNQQFEEAINYILPAESPDSQNIILLGYLGYANYMNDNTTAAEKYYQQIISIDSNNISANQYIAMLSKNEDPSRSVLYYRRLINLQPGKADNYRSMGELFKRLNKKDSAFLYYGHAYQLSPQNYKNAAGLADLLIDNKMYKNADSIIETALAKDSVNIPLLKLLVRSAYEADNYKNVQVPGERLIRLNEPSLTALTQLFVSYYNLKMYSDCIRVCDYLLLNGFAIENIFYYQAKAWAKLKDYNKSNALLKTCVSLAISKDAEMYYYNLGLNYEAMKQYKKAIYNYDTAYYLFKNPVMNYNSGRISEINLNNNMLAKKYYTEYLAKANPTEADEKKAYEYLKVKWGKVNTIKKN